MKFSYATLDTCHTATGLVVVIDVIRAFTNAAFVFSCGAEKIYPVGTVEEALELRGRIPGALACGEVGGIPPEGFDFGNSPTQTNTLDLRGRTIVQRTGSGTQGVVRSGQARQMVAASFVVAGATARYIRTLQPEEVTFVNTGATYDGGAEDAACAEYLEAFLRDAAPDVNLFLERVRNSHDGQILRNSLSPHIPPTDLDHCISADKFTFAMPITRENGRPVIHAVVQPVG